MPSAADLVVAMGPTADPRDQTPMLNHLRHEDMKKRAQSFTVKAPAEYSFPTEQLVNTVAASSDEEDSDGWGAWGDHPEVLNLGHRHNAHSTYSVTMQRAPSGASTRDGGISTDNSVQAGAVYILSAQPSQERQQAGSARYTATQAYPGQHYLASQNSGGSSQPTSPSGSQQAEVAVQRIHEALSQLPVMTEEQCILATQLLTKLSSGTSAAQDPPVDPQGARPVGFPANLRIITPGVTKGVTWDAVSPIASRFALHRPLDSDPNTPTAGTPPAGYEAPYSPGPTSGIKKPLKSLRIRTTMPAPEFSPLKSVRSIRRVRSPRAQQPTSARSVGAALHSSPFTPDSDESDDGNFFQSVERSTKSLHVSLLHGRPATVGPGSDASPMKTVRSVRRVGEGLSSPRASGQPPGSARKVRVRQGTNLNANSLRIPSDLRMSHNPGPTASPLRSTRMGSMSVPAAGRSMSRFSLAAAGGGGGGQDANFQGMNQGGGLDTLAMLRAEFAHIDENESEEGSSPRSHYLQGAPSPGPSSRGAGNNFLNQLYGSPAVLSTRLSSQLTPMSPSARSLMGEFNKADTPDGPKSTRKAAPTPRTLQFDRGFDDAPIAALGEHTPSDTDAEYESHTPDSILSAPQSPTASSPCPQPARAAFEAQLQDEFTELMPSFSDRSETASRPTAQQGYDPAAYAVIESRLHDIVKEHLDRHLTAQDAEGGFSGPQASLSPTYAPRAYPIPQREASRDGVLSGQCLPQNLHHLHGSAPAVPSPARAARAAEAEDADGPTAEGDWGSVHGSGGSSKFAPAARVAFEDSVTQAREARSSLPGNACMLPAVGAEPPSLQAWRGEDLLSPARSPTRSLRAAFDTAAEPAATAAAATAPGSPPRVGQDLSAPLTNMFNSPAKQAKAPGPASTAPVNKSPARVPSLRVEVPGAEPAKREPVTHSISMQIGSPDIQESGLAAASSYGSTEVQPVSCGDVASNPPSLGGANSSSPAAVHAAKAAPASAQPGAAHGQTDMPMSDATQSKLAQMNHMRFELSGLSRFLTTISASTSTLLSTLSIVAPGQALASPLTQLPGSPVPQPASRYVASVGPSIGATSPPSEGSTKSPAWMGAYDDLLRTQQQQACVLDQMQLQLAVLMQLHQLQALQELEKQMPGIIQQLRGANGAADLSALAAGLSAGSPLLSSPLTGSSPLDSDAGLCARPSKGLAYQHLDTTRPAPEAHGDDLAMRGGGSTVRAMPHPLAEGPDSVSSAPNGGSFANGLTIQTTVNKAMPRQPLSINTSLASAANANVSAGPPLSPVRPGLATRPPVSPASAGFLSPVRDLRGPYGPGSQSPRTPSRPDSPSAMRPAQDFSLKQTMNMVTNSLFGDDDL